MNSLMIPPFPIIYLRLYKGALLSCLIAFCLADKAMDLHALAFVTGYEIPEVFQAVRTIKKRGIIVRVGSPQYTRASWILSRDITDPMDLPDLLQINNN